MMMNAKSNSNNKEQGCSSSSQSSNQVLMIRPAGFAYNQETATSNSFQEKTSLESELLQSQVTAEFDAMVDQLRNLGIQVMVAEDTCLPQKPDAIFPNNWVSFHASGIMVLHPMKAINRRLERRDSLVSTFERTFQIKEIKDLSSSEEYGEYLEGTGSMVIDRERKVVYAALSPRTRIKALNEFCKSLDYQLIAFNTSDSKGDPIYHTNVMLTIGTDFALVCEDLISNDKEKAKLLDSLKSTGKLIISISEDQVNKYCGNMLELSRKEAKPLLVLSQSAHEVLNETQLKQLAPLVDLCPVQIETIEKVGGGSARCMITEIF
ncbi:MAG: citrulline utilization hydrolase CtlX [Croceimicrobium sp.]